MTDKDKQLDLNLGEVEYITDPNFVPERLVDRVGIDNLNKDHFLELIENIIQEGQHWIYYGDLNGEDFFVFESRETVSHITGIINGFEGLGKDPFLYGDKTLQSELARLIKEYNETDPEKYGTRSRLETAIEDCESWIKFKQFLEINKYEEVSIDDFNIEWGFSDEYDRCRCGNCDKIVRTSPNSYTWTPPLFIDGEGYISDDCVAEGDFDDYILEEYANVQKSIPESRDPSDLGLVQINEDSFQNGFFHGMDDTPDPIIESLNNADIDVWFVVHPSQFHCDFDVYVKECDYNAAVNILEGTDTYQGYSTAGNLEKALSSIKLQPESTEGVTVNTVDVSSGTVKTKVVSNQDFIDGKALD